LFAAYLLRHHPIVPERQPKFVYAVVYQDGEGKEKSIWYRTRQDAERAARDLKSQCMVKVLKV